MKKKKYIAPETYICKIEPANIICASGVGAVHGSQDDDYITPAKRHNWLNNDNSFEPVGESAWDKLDDKFDDKIE